jgi:quercetin dioxygenase-like cupin family protein
LLTLALAVVAGLSGPSAQAAEEKKIIAADAVEWGKGPASIPAGAEAAVLYGDPTADGLFAMRLKLPAGYHIGPHFHPKPEVVTIISGMFKLGTGETADPEATETLEPGALFAMHPGMAHYVYTDEETVVQLNSVGPWAITYFNAADDPRKTQ